MGSKPEQWTEMAILKRLEELATENRRLKEALEDYAEPKHWTWDGHAGHDVCVWNPMGDGYARAKEALEGKV